MAFTPHPSALVMLGDLRVAISQSTRAWKELNTTLGVVVSEFDERAGRALWHAFVP
jgi:hypothetical protein